MSSDVAPTHPIDFFRSVKYGIRHSLPYPRDKFSRGFSPNPPGGNKTGRASSGAGTLQSLYRIDRRVTVGASTSGRVLIFDASRTMGVKSFSMVTSLRKESERSCADIMRGKASIIKKENRFITCIYLLNRFTPFFPTGTISHRYAKEYRHHRPDNYSADSVNIAGLGTYRPVSHKYRP